MHRQYDRREEFDARVDERRERLAGRHERLESPHGRFDQPQPRFDQPQARFESPHGRYEDLQVRCEPPHGRYEPSHGRYEDRYEESHGRYDPPSGPPHGRQEDVIYERYKEQYEGFEVRNDRRSPALIATETDYQRVSNEPVLAPSSNININIGTGAPGGYQPSYPPPHNQPFRNDYEFQDSRREERLSIPTPSYGGSRIDCERPSSVHSYSHIAEIAAAHGGSPDSDLRRQYQDAAHGMHESYRTQSSCEFTEDRYASHMSAHADAYGDEHRVMGSDAIGAAAAIEALKITASDNQSNVRVQQGGGRPAGGFVDSCISTTTQGASIMGGRPPGGKLQGGRPSRMQRTSSASSSSCSSAGSGEERPTRMQGGPGGKPGGGPQDKIIALAMAQAGKLFDKKGGGDKQGKTLAMQTAGATAMRMMGEYKSTGKVNTEGGEMQKLMAVATSLF